MDQQRIGSVKPCSYSCGYIPLGTLIRRASTVNAAAADDPDHTARTATSNGTSPPSPPRADNTRPSARAAPAAPTPSCAALRSPRSLMPCTVRADRGEATIGHEVLHRRRVPGAAADDQRCAPLWGLSDRSALAGRAGRLITTLG